MCGIAGIINLKPGRVLLRGHTQELFGMLDRIASRGSDFVDSVENNDFKIGADRLVIVGGASGEQPLKSGSFQMVFNGEIYNYKNLNQDLLSEQTVQNSDSQVLFSLVQKFGMEKLNEFNGMFAFCFVNEDRIYLVRDRFGIKPLFYTYYCNSLYFASEIKAFLGIIPLELKINEYYPVLETNVGKDTVFKNVFQVKPGTYLEIKRQTGQVREIQYFDLTSIETKFSKEKDLIEEMRYLVSDAVKIRTLTDLEYGVYASGGLDSSIISILAKPRFLFTYLPGRESIPSEERYADILASSINNGILYQKIKPDPTRVLSNLISVVYSNDGPTTTLAAESLYLMAKNAKENGLRIVLSGLGADEFFNGYVRHILAYMQNSYFSADIFRGYEPLIIKARSSKKTKSRSEYYANILNHTGRQNKSFNQYVKDVFAKSPNTLSAISLCDSLLTLPPLLQTDDHINMAFSLEARSPFLDYRVVEFGLSLPEIYKINAKTGQVYTKYLLKKSFKDILPKVIGERKDKIGFLSNINSLFKTDLKGVVENSISILRTAFPNQKYFFDEEAVFGEYNRHSYQMVQLAISYLLFSKKMTINETYLRLKADKNNYSFLR